MKRPTYDHTLEAKTIRGIIAALNKSHRTKVHGTPEAKRLAQLTRELNRRKQTKTIA